MHRDNKLLDLLLIFIRDSKNPEDDTWINLTIKGYDPEIIQKHLKLLLEKGLINGIDASHTRGIKIIPKSLTSAGHDYIDERTKPFRKRVLEWLIKASGGLVGKIITGFIGAAIGWIFKSYLGDCK